MFIRGCPRNRLASSGSQLDLGRIRSWLSVAFLDITTVPWDDSLGELFLREHLAR